MSKYDALKEYLLGIDRSKEEIGLSFSEIESLLGFSLPKSARTYQAWWANQTTGSQAASWMNAGFRVQSVSAGRGTVRFSRTDGAGIGPSDTESGVLRERKRACGARESTLQLGNVPSTQDQPARIESPLSSEDLLNSGFSRIGEWETDGKKIQLNGAAPDEPGVYAMVVRSEVVYIGLATKSIKQRLSFYRNPGKSQSTNIRLNALIAETLANSVLIEVLVASPEPAAWNGLPVDMVTGLESGLIRKHQPRWNKKGI